MQIAVTTGVVIRYKLYNKINNNDNAILRKENKILMKFPWTTKTNP